ncbi:MAG: hypothetical protein LBT40_02980 [Deltaproteobacteria bacterium]|jgi:restriction endonuclease Mrr|nr:hypothetical protein [Deltaproteobacteria bacterium]
MTIPRPDDFLQPVLMLSCETAGATASYALTRMPAILGLSHADMEAAVPGKSRTRVESRVAEAFMLLEAAGLVEHLGRGVYAATDDGFVVMTLETDFLVRGFVESFPSFEDNLARLKGMRRQRRYRKTVPGPDAVPEPPAGEPREPSASTEPPVGEPREPSASRETTDPSLPQDTGDRPAPHAPEPAARGPEAASASPGPETPAASPRPETLSASPGTETTSGAAEAPAPGTTQAALATERRPGWPLSHERASKGILPKETALNAAVLAIMGRTRGKANTQRVFNRVNELYHLAMRPVRKHLSANARQALKSRTRETLKFLCREGLLDRVDVGTYVINVAGRTLLATSPAEVSSALIRRLRAESADAALAPDTPTSAPLPDPPSSLEVPEELSRKLPEEIPVRPPADEPAVTPDADAQEGGPSAPLSTGIQEDGPSTPSPADAPEDGPSSHPPDPELPEELLTPVPEAPSGAPAPMPRRVTRPRPPARPPAPPEDRLASSFGKLETTVLAVVRDKICRLRAGGLLDLSRQLAEKARSSSESGFPPSAGRWGRRVKGLFDGPETPGADDVVIRAVPFADGPAGIQVMEELRAEMEGAGAKRGIVFAPAGFAPGAVTLALDSAGRIAAVDADAMARLMYLHGEGVRDSLVLEIRVPDPDFLDRLDTPTGS